MNYFLKEYNEDIYGVLMEYHDLLKRSYRDGGSYNLDGVCGLLKKLSYYADNYNNLICKCDFSIKEIKEAVHALCHHYENAQGLSKAAEELLISIFLDINCLDNYSPSDGVLGRHKDTSPTAFAVYPKESVILATAAVQLFREIVSNVDADGIVAYAVKRQKTISHRIQDMLWLSDAYGSNANETVAENAKNLGEMAEILKMLLQYISFKDNALILEPCPKCGRKIGNIHIHKASKDKRLSIQTPYSIRCSCGYEFISGDDKWEEFANAWNTNAREKTTLKSKSSSCLFAHAADRLREIAAEYFDEYSDDESIICQELNEIADMIQ